MLKKSLNTLPNLLQRGQRIVNGLLNILKLNLTQIGYILLLIIVMLAGGTNTFFYHPTQGGVIVFFSLVIPSIALTLWAAKGTLLQEDMRLRLLQFVIPAALTMTVTAMVIAGYFIWNRQDIAYTQLAVTYNLMAMAIALVVFVQPPASIWMGIDSLRGDWRPTYLAVVSLTAFIALAFIPLATDLLRIAPLASIADYLIIALLTALWAGALLGIWRSNWYKRYTNYVADKLIPKRLLDREISD